MKLLRWLLIFACLPVFGQAVRYQGNVYTVNASAPQPGGLYPVLASTTATVQICTYSTTQTCPSLATTYTNASQATSCPTTAQLTPSNSGACTASVDAEGGFGAWLAAGNYQYMVTTSYGTFGPYDFTVGGGGGITALTGPVTASGSGSVASTITPTGVTPGPYTNSSITVNAAGQVTAAANGSGGGGTLTDNLLVNSPATTFFCETDSIGLPWTGDFCAQIQTILSLSTASINNIGSGTGADMASCATPGTGSCTQNGTFPLTFPLGVVNNSKALIEAYGYNDLSLMGGVPTNTQLSYFTGGLKNRILDFGIPDAQKIAANNTTYCTTSGTWTTASGTLPGGFGTFPSGSLQTSSNGATLTCTGQNATDAGFRMLKNVSSTASFTISVTNPGTSGSPFSVSDPYTGSATLNETAAYTSAWGAVTDFYAVGYPNGSSSQSPMSGGYTTVTLTSTSANPLYVIGPYFIGPSSSPQNAPSVEVMLETRAGCNGTCSTIGGSQHNDSNTNIMRAAQEQVVNELRNNGLNASYFDPNATPIGFNPSSTAQTSRVSSITVSAGGSGYTTAPIVAVTGCTVAPTFAVTISGGAVVTGGYNALTSGSCLGGTPVVGFSGGGGTGATGTAVVASDGTHPNFVGGTGIAVAAATILNSAATTADHFIPSAGGSGCTVNCTITSSSGTAALTLTTPQLGLNIVSSSAIGSQITMNGSGSGVHDWTINSGGTGLGSLSGGAFFIGDLTNSAFSWKQSVASTGVGYIETPSGIVNCWSSNVDVTATACDTGISRIGPNEVGVGNGTGGDISGTFDVHEFKGGTASTSGISGLFRNSDSANSPLQVYNYANPGASSGLPLQLDLAPNLPVNAFAATFVGLDAYTNDAAELGFSYRGGVGSPLNFSWFGNSLNGFGFKPGIGVCSDGSIATGINQVGSTCPLTGGGTTTPNLHTTVYTVATLPSASTSGAGAQVTVSDATTFTPGACVGGGSDYMIAISSGTSWSCH